MSGVGLENEAPVPSEPMRDSHVAAPSSTGATSSPYAYNPAPYRPPVARTEPVRQAGLPEPVSRHPAPRAAFEPSRRETMATGRQGSVEVVAGDTIYGIAKRHRVSISELMSANGLQNPMIRPGQRLVLPDSHRRSPSRRKEQVATLPRPSPPREVAVRTTPVRVTTQPVEPRRDDPPSGATQAPTSWTGTHTLTPRDSLYALARRYRVKVSELQSVNGISDPARLRAGAVLKVPGEPDDASTGHATSAPAPVPQAVAREAQTDLSSGLSTRPRIINPDSRQEEAPPERVAVAAPKNPVINDASPTEQPDKPRSAALPGKFRWPAKGRIIANFGPRGDNTHNDGINILVPLGTSVVAAEAGVVAYAGSELKGYGNLVLIRHEGNWVSAYAHNDSLLVRRGDRVERGQAVAKAGKTGAVDQPQVHFEIRQGSKPVDPLPHLER